MIEKGTILFPAAEGEEERTYYVYLPDEALDEPEYRYPVLYMFDGHNVFFDEDATYGKSWGMGEYLEATYTPLIVAAVECDHNPPNGRLCEYSPYYHRDHRAVPAAGAAGQAVGRHGEVDGEGRR